MQRNYAAHKNAASAATRKEQQKLILIQEMALEKQCDDLCMLIKAGVTQAQMAISVVAEKLTQSYSLCITPQVEAVEALLAKHPHLQAPLQPERQLQLRVSREEGIAVVLKDAKKNVTNRSFIGATTLPDMCKCQTHKVRVC